MAWEFQSYLCLLIVLCAGMQLHAHRPRSSCSLLEAASQSNGVYHAAPECPVIESTVKVYYVRHAQSLANLVSSMTTEEQSAMFESHDQMCKQLSDPVLTQNGIEDTVAKSADLWRLVQDSHVDAVFVSSFWRTLQTAQFITQILQDKQQMGEIIVLDELREGMHKPRQNKSKLQDAFPFVTNWKFLAESDPAIPLYKEWQNSGDSKMDADDGDKACPDAFTEPEQHLRQRQRAFLSTLMSMSTSKNWKNVVVVSHSKYGGAFLGRKASTKYGNKQSKAMAATIDYVDAALQKKLQNLEIRPFCLWETL